MSEQTSAEYRPGLDGVIAGESAICSVDPAAGLLYRGYDIHPLARRCRFEEVAWLLLRGELPTAAEAERFRDELAAHAALPAEVIAMLRLSPSAKKGGHPVDVLRTAVSMLGEFDPEVADVSHEANLRKALRIIAKIPRIIASSWRISQGNEPIESNQPLWFAERFLGEMKGQPPDPALVAAMNVVLILYAEHEFNASTFAARVTASTMADMYAAVTSALGTLKGPLHGGANEAAMAMIREIATPDRAEAWVKRKLAAHEKIMGFGHRVYKQGDSRVPAMRELARTLAAKFGEIEMVAVCERLEAVMEKEKNLYANLDLYAAPVLHLMGIPPELDISIFAAARAAGWCAHIIEQQDHNRLIRPRCRYIGPAQRELPE